MTHRIAWVCAAALAALLTTGCSTRFPYFASLETEKRFLGSDSVVFTKAEHRGIINLNVPPTSYRQGRILPNRVVCAEPSPDVAKVISDSFAAAAKVEIKGQEGEAQLSKSSAESLAQLGERLATIQLLRDNMYRACESYANGATSDVTYAVILSGISDTMVTLLAAELAAGAFGRSLAGIEGKATGKAGDQLPTDPKMQADLTNVNKELVKVAGEKATPETAAKKEELERQRDDLVARIASTSAGGRVASIKQSLATGATHAPKSVVEIHRASLAKDSGDALVFACIVALDRITDDTARALLQKTDTPNSFREFCANELIKIQGKMFAAKVDAGKARINLRTRYIEACGKLKDEDKLKDCLDNVLAI